jgi:hypothetical protein
MFVVINGITSARVKKTRVDSAGQISSRTASPMAEWRQQYIESMLTVEIS